MAGKSLAIPGEDGRIPDILSGGMEDPIMRMYIWLPVLFLAVFPVSVALGRSPMDLSQWSKTGGGSITLDIVRYTDGDNRRQDGKMLVASPWVGLFIHHSFAITGSFHLQSPFGNFFQERPETIRVTAGTRYFRQMYHFYGYVGLELGGLHSSVVGNTQKAHVDYVNENTKGFLAYVPAGVLFPLTRVLAIDLGVRVTAIWLSGGARWTETSMGYLGVFFTF